MVILIVAEEKVYRELLRERLEEIRPRCSVLEAADAQAALALLEENECAMLVCDLDLPDADGASFIRIATSSHQSIARVVVLSFHCTPYVAFRVKCLKLSGFLDKGSSSLAEIAYGLRVVARGGSYFSQRYLVAAEACLDRRAFFYLLSERELDVLALIARGMSDQKIATALKISSATAKTHRTRVLRKLGMGSTVELMVFPLRNKVVLRPFQDPVLMFG